MTSWHELRMRTEDYEEPDPPHPNDRMRCSAGHFVKRDTLTRGWKYTGPDYSGAPQYRETLPGEFGADAVEVWCPTCKSWFVL